MISLQIIQNKDVGDFQWSFIIVTDNFGFAQSTMWFTTRDSVIAFHAKYFEQHGIKIKS